MGITSSGFNFEDSFFNGQEGNIESTTSEIEDQNILFSLLFFVKAISNSSCGWLIDDSENVDTSDDTSILGGLSLGVIEIGRDSDDCIFDSLTEERLCSFLHLGQDHG